MHSIGTSADEKILLSWHEKVCAVTDVRAADHERWRVVVP